ncbi:unnamed protein product, partial [marine sediment metagenome]
TEPLIKKRIKLASIVLGLLLTGLIGLLVRSNYISLVKLHDSALKQLIYDTERLATVTSYFYSERKDDLKDLAESRELSIFFENKALGMSMDYGLKASLLVISERFDRLLNEKKFDDERIYTRIVFIHSSGELLIDRMPLKNSKGNFKGDWKKYLVPNRSEPAIITEYDGELLGIAISIPYFFKSQYAGQILAWVSPKPIYEHLIRTKKKLSNRLYGIVCQKGNFYFAIMGNLIVPYKVQFDFGKVENWKSYHFDAAYNNGEKLDIIATRV